MRLYLSSFDIGNQSDKLVELVSGGKKVVIIVNALDHKSEVRERFLKEQTQKLKNLGFDVEELDLRNYFNKANDLADFLKDKYMVWVNGGNTFILRRAMKQSGFDKIITDLLKEDKIVYAGFSAGCVVLHKDLHGLDITDNPNNVPEGYNEAVIWDGLGLIDFSIAVHYQSDHAETKLTDKEIEYYKEKNIPYETLKDGQVIFINGEVLKKLD